MGWAILYFCRKLETLLSFDCNRYPLLKSVLELRFFIFFYQQIADIIFFLLFLFLYARVFYRLSKLLFAIHIIWLRAQDAFDFMVFSFSLLHHRVFYQRSLRNWNLIFYSFRFPLATFVVFPIYTLNLMHVENSKILATRVYTAR